MNRHFTATGLAFDGEKVLLVKHATLGWWLPPGGDLDVNEDPAEAVLREVEQETGLACEAVCTLRKTQTRVVLTYPELREASPKETV
jgi:8-oxo-dGTP pyrophosphatase MutT (NUDIX family)